MVLFFTSPLLLWEIWAILGQHYRKLSSFKARYERVKGFSCFLSSPVRLALKVAKILVQNRFPSPFNFIVLVVPESKNISVKQECTYLVSLQNLQLHKHQVDPIWNCRVTQLITHVYPLLLHPPRVHFPIGGECITCPGCQQRKLIG